jgi:hypothetical protein
LSKLSDCNTDMGNTCFATGLAKCLLKQRIRCEMTGLLYKIINECANVSVTVNRCAVDTNRFTNLMKQMSVVRTVSNEWTDLMRLCVNAGEPICVTIRKILDLMTECGSCIRIADILCLCTYVTDLCVDILTRNNQADVCEIIETLVDYILEKNIVMCINFLHYIDAV